VPVYIDRIHKIETAKPPLIRLTGIINKGRYDLALPISFSQWSPVLRGSRTESGDGDFRGRREVFNDGLLEYEILLKTRQEQEFRLYPGWFMALIGNAICAAERFRDTAGTPHIEYGLEIEILNSGSPLPIGQYGGNFGRFLGPMPEGHHVFPRYSINQRDEFQQLAQIIERDFWNLCGHDWDEKDLVMVDFEQAFTNLGLTKK
jgi:hypothetical protein